MISSPAVQKTSSRKDPVITTEVVDKITDQSLYQYSFYQDNNKNNQSLWFDSISDVPITNTGSFDNTRAVNSRNTRWITFNIPAIDALSRSNPFVKKSVNYLSSKPLINGIDINSQKSELTTEDETEVLEYLKTLYISQKEVLTKGHTYGGSAGLLWFSDQTDKEDLKKPLIISKIKKGSFLGIKPLARWFQVEPALDKELIKDVGADTGFSDARMIGMPMYYNVNLSGGMIGDPTRSQLLVHASRLLPFNAELPSFIETQIERFWGPSIVELAWSELSKDSRLWSAITKSAEKNNMSVLKIDGLALASQVNTNVKNRFEARMELMKNGSSRNVIPIDSKDALEFISGSLQGSNEVLALSNSRLAGAFNVPVSVLFPNDKGDSEDKSYIQSLSALQDIQERVLRPWYNTLLPVIIKSLIGKTVKNIMFSFNPIETQTLKERADMAKTNTETIKELYGIGVIDKSSGIQMADVIGKDPKYLAQNISEEYKKQIMEKAKNGEFETANSDKMELAAQLNQMQAENGKGTSGVPSPASDKGKDTGGDPTKSDKPLKRDVLNPEKGKK